MVTNEEKQKELHSDLIQVAAEGLIEKLKTMKQLHDKYSTVEYELDFYKAYRVLDELQERKVIDATAKDIIYDILTEELYVYLQNDLVDLNAKIVHIGSSDSFYVVPDVPSFHSDAYGMFYDPESAEKTQLNDLIDYSGLLTFCEIEGDSFKAVIDEDFNNAQTNEDIDRYGLEIKNDLDNTSEIVDDIIFAYKDVEKLIQMIEDTNTSIEDYIMTIIDDQLY